MRVLFVHKYCPGQFGSLAAAFAAVPGNEVVFVCEQETAAVAGVRIVTVRPARQSAPPTHHYVQTFENAVLRGQAVYRACNDLRRDGFAPDVIYAHAGFGPGLYVRDAFPRAGLIGYFEWFYRAQGSDADFLAPARVTEDEALRIRTRNAVLLLELAQCDQGLCPTGFQRDQFPPEFHAKLTVLHDGVDTDGFCPGERGTLSFAPFDGQRLPEIVTYAARGLEPYRGFPQFMRALTIVQARRPSVQAVVVGEDSAFYGPPPDGGRTWKEQTLAENPDIDTGRIHFLGWLDSERYRGVLRASHAHVYLTVPFVLSWSLLEAMATGCTVIGSDTPPVREIVTDGETGYLAAFNDSAAIADRICRALEQRDAAMAVGAAARRHMVDHYSLKTLLPRHFDLAGAVAAAGHRDRPAMRGPVPERAAVNGVNRRNRR